MSDAEALALGLAIRSVESKMGDIGVEAYFFESLPKSIYSELGNALFDT